jgi:hypothetical protein
MQGQRLTALGTPRTPYSTHGPNLGLSTVDLNDGSYSTTRIYLVQGTPGSKNLNKPIGDFYQQFNGDLCAYHIPGGSFSMRFTDSNADFVDDGQGGRFLEGTFELTILEGTGIYKPFAGGHNHMVDKLHFLPPRRRLRRRRRVLLLLHQPPMNNT